MPVAYAAIASSDTAAGAPVSTTLMTSLNNNLQAFAEGDAPFKLEDAALGSTVTAAGKSWVAARSVIPSLGAIGSHAFLAYTGTDTTISPGEEKTGFLSYAGVDQTGAVVYGSAASGTWRAVGYVTGTSGTSRATTWVRIS